LLRRSVETFIGARVEAFFTKIPNGHPGIVCKGENLVSKKCLSEETIEERGTILFEACTQQPVSERIKPGVETSLSESQ
jgi:hypothetical protein